MANKLNTFVHVVERDAKGNQVNTGVFGPNDHLPDWAVRAITNPDVWAERDPEPARQQRAAGDGDGDGGQGGGERPRGNASRDAWAGYAASLDPPVQLADEMTRDDIIAAVDARN